MSGAGVRPQDEVVSDPEDEAADHERRRARGSRRVLGVGVLLGLLAAGVLGGAAGDGRAGLAYLLVVTALGSAAAGLHHGVLLLLDDVRGRPTSLRRGLRVGGYFALTAALMAAVVGVGG